MSENVLLMKNLFENVSILNKDKYVKIIHCHLVRILFSKFVRFNSYSTIKISQYENKSRYSRIHKVDMHLLCKTREPPVRQEKTHFNCTRKSSTHSGTFKKYVLVKNKTQPKTHH